MFSRRPEVTTMTVGVVFDGSDELKEIEREFVLSRKDGKDKVSKGINLLPALKGNQGEMDRRVVSIIGEFPVMLDVHRFIRLSDAKRAELIFSFCKIDQDEWNIAKVRERLSGASPSDAWNERFSVMKNFGSNLQEGVKAALEYLGKEQSTLRAGIRGN